MTAPDPAFWDTPSTYRRRPNPRTAVNPPMWPAQLHTSHRCGRVPIRWTRAPTSLGRCGGRVSGD